MIQFLFSQYKDYSSVFIFLELTAVVFGIISVLFARKNNILVYPTGLVSTLIYVYILLEWKLFGDFNCEKSEAFIPKIKRKEIIHFSIKGRINDIKQ